MYRRKTSTIQVENLQAMYYDTYEKVDQDYISTLTTCYTAKVQNLNFNDTKRSVNFINNAINTETKGLIRDAITEDDVANARILLTSTLYFKGQWQVRKCHTSQCLISILIVINCSFAVSFQQKRDTQRDLLWYEWQARWWGWDDVPNDTIQLHQNGGFASACTRTALWQWKSSVYVSYIAE